MQEVPVLTQAPPYPATGTLFILDNGDGSYSFYTKNGSTWNLGGGVDGVIYIADNGDIFRSASGATPPGSVAAKISQSPYTINQTVTSGVQLVLNNGELRAQGVVATTQSAGVVKVSTTNTNGAALTIAVDGTLAATATVGDSTHPGTVVVAGTTADYNYAKTPAGGNHADSYIVPTVKFMYDYVDEYVPSVDFATTTNPGIVRIDPLGNINVGDSGLISVPNADANTAGVVKILNKVNTTIDENALKAVTQAGIIDYVGSALNGYQQSLTPGDGIDITERTISADIKAPIAFDGGKMTVQDASTAATGVVLITGDSAYISGASTSLAGHPLAVNPKAVHDYVIDALSQIPIEIPIATSETRGGFKTSGTSTGLTMVSAANGTSADVLKINAASPLTINTNNQLTALPASAGGLGVVQMQALSTAASTDAAYTVPQAYDVKHYVDEAIAGVDIGAAPYVANKTATTPNRGTIRVVSGSGIVLTEGTTAGNIYLDSATTASIGGVIVGNELTGLSVTDGRIKIDPLTTGPIYIDDNNKLTASAATQDSAGVVKITQYDSANNNNFVNLSNVPTGSAVSSFVTSRISTAISGKQDKITAGEALAFGNSDLTSNTLSVQYVSPLYLTTSKLSVSAAVAGSQTVLNNNAFGAVWVRHKIRAASVIEDDARVDATVPSEKAVREFVDAIPYITYEQLQ